MSQATKKGYHKGCFGSSTLEQRKAGMKGREHLYSRARSYATSYLRRRMGESAKYRDRMSNLREQRRGKAGPLGQLRQRHPFFLAQLLYLFADAHFLYLSHLIPSAPSRRRFRSPSR